MPINTADFDFDAIYAALQKAHESHLTLCIAADGGWACETSAASIENQFMRIAATNYTRASLEAKIRSDIDAINGAS